MYMIYTMQVIWILKNLKLLLNNYIDCVKYVILFVKNVVRFDRVEVERV